MSNDIKNLADVQPGGRVRLGDQACDWRFSEWWSGLPQDIGVLYPYDIAKLAWQAALSAQPSTGGQGDSDLSALAASIGEVAHRLSTYMPHLSEWADRARDCKKAAEVLSALAARQPVGEPVVDYEDLVDQAKDLIQCGCSVNGALDWLLEQLTDGEALAAPPAQAVDLGQTFQARVAEWMGQCFLPSLYSNMTERGDRLLEEVLELLQANGYDKARVPTLVDYVFGRPIGEPAQEVGGVMVTLAGYCWVAGLDMHAAGDAELARINQPEVMAKIRAKQEAKNALHFDMPLPGDAGAAIEEWPREGDLVRYGDGCSSLAIRLGPHAGGWHGYQCCGGYTFFTKAYRPSRADMDTWLDCAKYRDERTKVADNRVAHEMYLIDHQAEVARD